MNKGIIWGWGIIWGCGFIEIDNVDLDLALSAITKELEKNLTSRKVQAHKFSA